MRNIKFPVYPISGKGTVFRDGTALKYRTPSGVEYVIDDIAIEGRFYRRRIILRENLLPTEKILELKRSITTIGNFILYTSIYTHFIDTEGRLFKYKKEVFVSVVKKNIIKAVPYKSGSMLFIEDVHCPFMFYRPVTSEEKYAVLIPINKGYILLGITTNGYLKKRRIRI